MERKDKISGVVFIGCMFVGMGLGDLFDNSGPGMLIGMGAGFLSTVLFEMKK